MKPSVKKSILDELTGSADRKAEPDQEIAQGGKATDA
jgi:hypothetical protein